MNQFSITSKLQPNQQKNHLVNRISMGFSFALAGIFALTLSACHGPCRTQCRTCGPVATVVYDRPVKMDSCESCVPCGPCQTPGGYSSLAARPVTMKPGACGTSCRFSHAEGCAPAAVPNRFQMRRQATVMVVPPHDPVIVPSRAPAVAPSKPPVQTQAPARSRTQVRQSVPQTQAPGMKQGTLPEMGPEAQMKVKPEAKPALELESMPFDEQTLDGPMMQERENVPGKAKVLEVPQNASGAEPSFQELPFEEPAEAAQPVPVESIDPADSLDPAETLVPAETLDPAEALDPAETLDPAEPAGPAGPAEPFEPFEPADSLDPAEPAEPAVPVNPMRQGGRNTELPGLEEELPDTLPNELPDALPEPTLLEIPEGSKEAKPSAEVSKRTTSYEFKRAIQKRQPLKKILSLNEAQSESKTGFPAQSGENSAEKQTSSVPQNENALRSISFTTIRKATGMEEEQAPEIQSASWEVVEKEGSVIQLTAGEEPVASNPEPLPVVQEPAELPASMGIESFPERPSNAQPADEYIIDSKSFARRRDLKEAQKGMAGGVEVKGNWEADIQNETGTFIFYDGVQGRSTIQSPDPVYIYAPRFRAVRQVLDLNVDEQVTMTGDLYTPTQVSTANRSMETSTTRQNQQAGTGTTRTVMLEAQANAGTGVVDGNVAVQMKTQEAVIAQENRMINGPGAIDGKTRAITADGLIEVKSWTQTENMRVFIDKQSASASVQSLAAPSLYTVQEGEKKQDVKIYKVASTNSARPGETIDFIIYFENTGNSPIGNITLVDNLPARLEIIEDSAESSVDSNFTYEINGNGSQTLRWEVTQPLYVGEKGAVKFKALVR